MAEELESTAGFADYLRILRRRKWPLAVTALAVPAIAIGLTLRQAPTYQASVKVLLDQQNPVNSLLGTQGSGSPYVDPARAAQTQADLARVLEVTRRAVAASHVPGLTTAKLLVMSSVTASLGSDFLTFAVTARDPAVAARLANSYADAYVGYRRAVDIDAIARARAALERREEQLRAAGLAGTPAFRSLQQQVSDLDTMQAPVLKVLHSAYQAAQIGPRVGRNGGVGVVLGLVLGIVVAFLWDVFDTRVRSLEKIRGALHGLPVLGRLPPPPRSLRKSDRLVMMVAPTSDEAEPFRVLRANFDLATGQAGARTIMVTSGVGGEGKSTTAANLGVALARAGRRVVLVDFDLRSPYLHRLFGLAERPGLIDVALGRLDLDHVLANVPLADGARSDRNGSTNTAQEGKLHVIPVGGVLEDPDELRIEFFVEQVLENLQTRADCILIDAGPLLPSGDPIALSAYVEAILLVVRLNAVPSGALDDLRRALASSPAIKLGLAVTNADAPPPDKSYRSGSASRRQAARGKREDDPADAPLPH